MYLAPGKWGVAYEIEIPAVKRAVVDFSVSADWTPATNDSKISIDGGNVANTSNLPAILGGTGAAAWKQTITGTEMRASKRVYVQWIDAATKAIEDQAFIIPIEFGVRSNVAQGGGATSITLDASASSVTDFYVGMEIEILDGTGVGQIRFCTAYNGTSKVATVHRAWATNPDSTSIFRVANNAEANANVTQWLGTAVSTPTVAGVPNVNVKTWNDLTTVALPLVPTTAGRTLDVSANGNAGTDQANIDNPTAVQDLSGTTVASVTAGVTLAASAVQAIWDAATSALTTVGSIGKLLVDNINATISSRLASASYTAPDNSGIASILADTNELQTDWTNGGRLDLLIDAILADTDSLDTTKITTARAAVLTDWIDGGRLDLLLDAVIAKTNLIPASPAAVGDIPTVTQIWSTALTEAYRATGSTGTAAQLMYEILQNITEFSIGATTKTVKKLDGSTTAKTYTLNDATNPTSITETT